MEEGAVISQLFRQRGQIMPLLSIAKMKRILIE